MLAQCTGYSWLGERALEEHLCIQVHFRNLGGAAPLRAVRKGCLVTEACTGKRLLPVQLQSSVMKFAKAEADAQPT